MSKIETKTIGSVYMHICNSGATISIIDRGFGPTIKIGTSSFGNINNSTEIFTDKESLKELVKLFTKAIDEEYSNDYCNKAVARK